MSRLLRGVPAAGGSACRKHGAVTSASSSPLLHLLEKAERGGCPGPIEEVTERNKATHLGLSSQSNAKPASLALNSCLCATLLFLIWL